MNRVAQPSAAAGLGGVPPPEPPGETPGEPAGETPALRGAGSWEGKTSKIWTRLEAMNRIQGLADYLGFANMVHGKGLEQNQGRNIAQKQPIAGAIAAAGPCAETTLNVITARLGALAVNFAQRA